MSKCSNNCNQGRLCTCLCGKTEEFVCTFTVLGFAAILLVVSFVVVLASNYFFS